jgi:carboxymethylenebutenolidase
VVHENRGLNPYIEDVGRRAAVDGFITLAPDALSPLGGYPMMMWVENYKKRTREEMLEDFIAAYNTKSTQRLQRTYCSWFCFGGWIANMMAVKSQPWRCSSVLWWPTHSSQPNS